MDDRRERHRQPRYRKRSKDGKVVVLEFDASGLVVRETYYTPDRAWVTKIVEDASDQSPKHDSD
jgi:hypothetical protein